jgi:outer membrane scaffolding protein for murein synthesis (MipA/OmpV family)
MAHKLSFILKLKLADTEILSQLDLNGYTKCSRLPGNIKKSPLSGK